MATASVTNNFAAGTPAVADEVDVNFADLVTFLNAETVHKDGSIAMTGILALPGSDPTTANQATRKAYVDAQDTAINATIAAKVAKAGDTMTGALTLPASDPTDANHAARKTYVDAQAVAAQVAAQNFATNAVNNEANTRSNADTARVTAPAIATNPKVVGASTVGVTNADGRFSIATGLGVSMISATATIGDPSTGGGLGTAIFVQIDWPATTTGSLAVQVFRRDNGAPVGSGTSVRVNWIALGS